MLTEHVSIRSTRQSGSPPPRSNVGSLPSHAARDGGKLCNGSAACAAAAAEPGVGGAVGGAMMTYPSSRSRATMPRSPHALSLCAADWCAADSSAAALFVLLRREVGLAVAARRLVVIFGWAGL